MVQPGFSCADAAAAEMTVEIAETPEQMLEAQRLRYKVYCEERGFEAGDNGLEQDQFDGASHHVLVRSRASGRVVGTVRVVCGNSGSAARPTGMLMHAASLAHATPAAGRPLSSSQHHLKGNALDPWHGFPMRRVCASHVLAPLPAAATGEISRFALTRDRSGLSPAAAAMMRLFLMRGVVQVSGQNGLTHWCAMMELSLLRLLQATGVHFRPVGPSVEYHGTRLPTVAAIRGLLDRMRYEQPLAWAFTTADGALWRDPDALARYVA